MQYIKFNAQQMLSLSQFSAIVLNGSKVSLEFLLLVFAFICSFYFFQVSAQLVYFKLVGNPNLGTEFWVIH